jgi:gas vesicle protein GvpL/GvpF
MHQSVTARSNRVRRALSHRYARLHVPPGHVVWVYAITDSLAPDQLAGLTGVGGESVRVVTEAGLTAVVGSVEQRTFGERARAGLMSDLPSIERLARAHHRVIACVAADGPVLPLRLGSIYPDDHTVRTLLGRSSAEFAMILDSFRGTEEWGVKVYAGEGDAADPHAAGEGTADEVGSPDALSRLGDPAPGDSEPDGDLVKPVSASEDPEAFAEMVDRALAGIAIASRHYAPQDPRIDSSGKSLVLNAAYLVLSDRASEFTAVARALTRAHRGVGAGLTGPWPPYSFADVGPV